MLVYKTSLCYKIADEYFRSFQGTRAYLPHHLIRSRSGSTISNYSTRMCPTCDQDPNPRSYCIICSPIKVSIPVHSGGTTTDAGPHSPALPTQTPLRGIQDEPFHPSNTHPQLSPHLAPAMAPSCVSEGLRIRRYLGNNDRYSARCCGRGVCNSSTSIFLISRGQSIRLY